MPASAPITDFVPLTGGNVADIDLLVIVDISDTTDDPTGTTKKITSADFLTKFIPDMMAFAAAHG